MPLANKINNVFFGGGGGVPGGQCLFGCDK